MKTQKNSEKSETSTKNDQLDMSFDYITTRENGYGKLYLIINNRANTDAKLIFDKLYINGLSCDISGNPSIPAETELEVELSIHTDLLLKKDISTIKNAQFQYYIRNNDNHYTPSEDGYSRKLENLDSQLIIE